MLGPSQFKIILKQTKIYESCLVIKLKNNAHGIILDKKIKNFYFVNIHIFSLTRKINKLYFHLRLKFSVICLFLNKYCLLPLKATN